MKFDKSSYLKHGGGHCPYCDSRNIMAIGQIQGNDYGATCQIECHDCGKFWIDIYHLVDVEEGD